MAGPVSIAAFILVAFAAFAVPTAIAYVLFNLIRKDPPPPDEITPRRLRRTFGNRSPAIREPIAVRRLRRT